MGVFLAADPLHDDLGERYKVKRVGSCDGVEDQFFAIAARKKVLNPLVRKLASAQH